MTDAVERTHAWSHLVLFLMIFMLALAVMRFSTPTGLATGNNTITAQSVGDLKPFLTAVGLLMGLFIAIVIAYNANIGTPQRTSASSGQRAKAPAERVAPAQQRHADVDDINRQLAEIRRKIGR